ncbi:MAG: hypothetical protein QOG73_3767 [Acetobacteraceae bacterium]|nr:hypothetical protein [Acetobacteraceae bacterium]
MASARPEPFHRSPNRFIGHRRWHHGDISQPGDLADFCRKNGQAVCFRAVQQGSLISIGTTARTADSVDQSGRIRRRGVGTPRHMLIGARQHEFFRIGRLSRFDIE